MHNDVQAVIKFSEWIRFSQFIGQLSRQTKMRASFRTRDFAGERLRIMTLREKEILNFKMKTSPIDK